MLNPLQNDTFLTFLLGLSRPVKRLIQVLIDVVLLSLSFTIAMWLRLEDFNFIRDFSVWLTWAVVLPSTIAIFMVMGFYRAVVCFVSMVAIQQILVGIFASATLLFIVNQLSSIPIPRSVPAIYLLLGLLSIAGVRLSMRAIYSASQRPSKSPVIIYGAGRSGRQLLAALHRGPEYNPVAFVDDDTELHGVDVSGLRVFPPNRLPYLIEKHCATSLLLAIPALNRTQRQIILERLKGLPLQVRTVPGSADIVSGKASVSDLLEVSIEDLLGREPVPPDRVLMLANIQGRSVMVTGAGGSIGAELCRQIVTAKPSSIVLFEQSEYALYAIHQEMLAIAGLSVRIIPVLGSVCNSARVRETIASFEVATIYHAAAYKHVPMVEMNVVEGIRNNIFGTLTVATASAELNVKALILVSTDKAVRPTSIMGASKRIAEMVCQALSAQQNTTLISMVRFGNVLGSSGSVIPLFRQQINSGGPITVTHPEITRFFMTIPEAAQLVIQAGAMAKGGDVFMLDMGDPVRIVDLAQRMVQLHGLTPVVLPNGVSAGLEIEGDIAIVFSSLRPGEKLFEELLIDGTAEPTCHPRIKTATEMLPDWSELSKLLVDLEVACDHENVSEIRRLLVAARTGYAPTEYSVELATHERSSRGHQELAAE